MMSCEYSKSSQSSVTQQNGLALIQPLQNNGSPLIGQPHFSTISSSGKLFIHSFKYVENYMSFIIWSCIDFYLTQDYISCSIRYLSVSSAVSSIIKKIFTTLVSEC